MVMTDPIANFLTCVRNANMIKHESSEVPISKIKRDIAEALKHEGSVCDVGYIEDDKQGVVRVFLKFDKNGEHAITNLKHASKSGLRAYIKANEVPEVLNGLGIITISISEGAVTNKGAREENIGGEVIAYIW